MSKIVRNGVIIYESRRGQFGHMSYEEFISAVRKDCKSKRKLDKGYSMLDDLSNKDNKQKRKKWFRKGGIR